MTKQLLVVIVMVCAVSAHAQLATFVVSHPAPMQSIDTTFLKFKTIEEALGLPAAYSVKQYAFIFSSKGEIFKWESAWNDNFHLAWVVARAKKGDKLTIDNIVVVKDGVEKKWMPKTFTF